MNVLITGARGQVGCALRSTAPSTYHVTAVTHAELDITDASAVESIVDHAKPALIINAAAYTAVDRAESEVEAARKVNVDGAANLARAAARRDARVFHLSTDFVFDGAASLAYAPDAPTNPLSVYGTTKRDGELAVLGTAGARALVLRTAWVYAAEGSNFLRTMLRLMRERRAVRVVADQIGTPTSARSIATVLWKLAALPQASGTHHWTDAGVATWYDFAVAIAEEGVVHGQLTGPVTVTPIASSEYPTAARRPRFSVLNSKRTVETTGIEPEHWRVALRRVLGEMSRA